MQEHHFLCLPTLSIVALRLIRVASRANMPMQVKRATPEQWRLGLTTIVT